MISFGLSEEQEMVRDTLREFAAQAVRPIERECDESSSIPDSFLDAAWELGLTSTQLPEACGGGGCARRQRAGARRARAAIRSDDRSRRCSQRDHQTTAAKPRSSTAALHDLEFHAASLARRAGIFDPTRRNDGGAEGRGVGVGSRSAGRRREHLLAIASRDGVAEAFIVPREATGH